MKSFVLFLSSVFLFSNCMTGPAIIGSGDIVTEKRAVSGFHTIKLKGIGTVYLTQDTTESLVLETDDNIVGLLETDVAGGVLSINIEHDRSVKPTQLYIYVSMRTIHKLEVNGSGVITGRNTIVSDNLDLSTNGSGNVTLAVKTSALFSKINGSSDYTLSGLTDSHTVEISGSGNISSYSLASRKTDIAIDGSGRCQVNVSESLHVNISGSGDVRYMGNPLLTKKITGSGQVKPQ